MRKFLSLLAMLACIVSGSCGSDNPQATHDQVQVSTGSLDGASNIATNGYFTKIFSAPVDTSTVTSQTFFLQEVTPAAGTCNPTKAISSFITCPSNIECSLYPAALLASNTNYLLCLTAGIRYESGESIVPSLGIQHDGSELVIAETDRFTTAAGQAYFISGTVIGLTGTNLVLQNNDGDDKSISANGPFTFTSAVIDGSAYAVTVLTQPAGETCVVSNGTGIITGANINNIIVVCSSGGGGSYTIGGTAINLSGTIVLQNTVGAAVEELSVSAAGSFAFLNTINNGSEYAVTIKTQPANQTCVVSNGTGTVTGANVNNVILVCTGGGVTIDEVYATYYLGNMTIKNASDIAALEGVRMIFGSLTIDPTCNVASIDLSSLEYVSGAVSIQSVPALQSLDLSSFASVGAAVTISSNTSLTSLSLPSLTSTSSGLSITGNTALTSISLPLFASTSILSISTNTALTSLSLPVLTTVTGTTMFSGNTSLSSISLPALTSSRDISITSNTSLTSISLPALVSLAGGTFGITSNTALTSFSLPVLVTAPAISITGNTALTDFSFPALTTLSSVSGITISGNTLLTSISFPVFTTFTSGTTNSTSIASNPALTSISFPALITSSAGLSITSNTSLTSVSFPVLTTFTGTNGLVITNNTAMRNDSLNFSALVKLGNTNTSLLTITGNRTAGVNGLTDSIATALRAQLIGPPVYSGSSTIFNNNQ